MNITLNQNMRTNVAEMLPTLHSTGLMSAFRKQYGEKKCNVNWLLKTK